MNRVENDVLELLPAHPPRAWPAHRTVAELMGWRPMGGQVPATPVRGFVQTPSALRLSDTAPGPATRIDIALGGLTAFLIDPVLSDSECAALIEASERLGFRDEAPGISTPPGMRMNKTVHWLADEALMVPIFQRMAGLLPQRLDGATLLPRLSHRLNMYRYDDGDVFNVHIDGDWPGYALDPLRQRMVEWPSGRARLTMLLYLNGLDEGVQGGATRLLDAGGRSVDVTTRRGTALFFRHGFHTGSVRHIGCMVHGAVPKYVARMNVMYDDA